MAWRWLQIILIAAIPCGGLCQTAYTQVPTKIPGDQVPTKIPGDGRDWINPPPRGSFAHDAVREIEESDYYEVVASKRIVPVIRDLKDRMYVKLTPDEAVYFTGPYFRCPKGKTPYPGSTHLQVRLM